MSSMQDPLPIDLQQFVDHQIDSGKFASTREVIQEALKVFREFERTRELKRDDLRAEIQLGLDELDNGKSESFDLESIKRDLRTKIQQVE